MNTAMRTVPLAEIPDLANHYKTCLQHLQIMQGQAIETGWRFDPSEALDHADADELTDALDTIQQLEDAARKMRKVITDTIRQRLIDRDL